MVYIIAYIVAVTLSWMSLVFMVLTHASRIAEGKSLGVFGVTFSIVGFGISFLFYFFGQRSGLKYYQGLAYWTPILIAIVIGMTFKVTFAP